jgi:hypothetical protein
MTPDQIQQLEEQYAKLHNLNRELAWTPDNLDPIASLKRNVRRQQVCEQLSEVESKLEAHYLAELQKETK